MSLARRTALFSLGAALALVAVKTIVGLAIGSLGVLAEAAHSGVDAAAALIAFYAVSVAERPADAGHHYGHGKAQHLSALAEAAVLGAVAVAIGIEAILRLRAGADPVEPTWYAFALLGGVLAVDAARALASLRAARTLRSAALLASAWHFGSDLLGTAAVLAGLALAEAGYGQGDALAAILVAGLVLVAAVRLGARNVAALMDEAPAGLGEQVRAAAAGVPGVEEVRDVRVRESGGEYFAEVVIGVPRLSGLERTHDVSDAVESAVSETVGPARVTVHVEPSAGGERAVERVVAAALRVPGVMEVHNVTVLDMRGQRTITLHARIGSQLSLEEGEPVLAQLREEIAREAGAARVVVHAEPFDPDPERAEDVTAREPELCRRAGDAMRRAAGCEGEVTLYRQGERLVVVGRLAVDPGLSVAQGHGLAGRVEDEVRAAVPEAADVVVEVRGAT